MMTRENGASSAPAKVLVADDGALVAMSLVTILEDLGHEVVEANSGREALSVIENDRTIDLVVTDQSMPGMSGTDLARAVLALRPSLPVLLATGYHDVPEGSELGLERIRKPFDEREVAKSVARLLAKPTP